MRNNETCFNNVGLFLKTTPTFETVDQNYVTSDAFDGSCGIELSVGTVYYMTGQIFYIKLHIFFYRGSLIFVNMQLIARFIYNAHINMSLQIC